MKIKVAILESDQNYLSRITKVFCSKYTEELQIFSFTDLDTAINNLQKNRINLLIASELFDVPQELIPQNCGFAYLVENHDIDSVKGMPAICKFQKVDLIYKQLLSLYSDLAINVSQMKFSNSSCKMVAFSSPCGGTGTSTMAATYAIVCAKRGNKVLYLNLETFGSADTFFSAEGQYDMSDIIYALKSRKTNVSIKIESCVKQDASGVYFFSQPKRVLDFMELQYEDIELLINELQLSGKYDHIVVDVDFDLCRDALRFFEKMDTIVMVSDGSVIANMKLFRAYGAIQMLEENLDYLLSDKLAIVYNKFSSKTSRMLEAMSILGLGGAPRYEHATTEQIVRELSNKALFDSII